MELFQTCKSGFKLCAKLGITGLVEKSEHILLVCFNAGLVEGVYAKHIAGNCASLFKEVYEVTEIKCAAGGECNGEVRNVTVGVREDGTVVRLLVNEVDLLVSKEVEAVAVFCIEGNLEAVVDVDVHNGFEHDSGAFLNELTDGVEVGGIDCAGGIETLAVFAFGFAEELFPPFAGHGESGIVRGEDLNALALSVEDVTDCRIFETAVGENVAVLEILVSLCRACEHFFDISAGNGDGEETYGSQNGVSAADVVSDHEAFVAVSISLRAESALLCVGGSENTFCRAFLAVFFR